MLTCSTPSTSARDAIILELMPLASRIGRSFGRYSDPCETEACAMLALVEVCSSTPHHKLTPAFVSTAIKNDLRDRVRAEGAGSRIPRSLIDSLDSPIGMDDGEGDLTLADVMPDANAVNPETAAIEMDFIEKMLAQIPTRQRRVVSLHLGLDGQDATRMADVARELGINRDTAFRDYKSAMETLRQNAA